MTKLFLCLTLPALAFIGLISGCKSPVNLEPIVITIESVSPTETSTQIQLLLTYTSSNVYPVGIKTTEGKLYLDGDYVGKVRRGEPVGAPQLITVKKTARLFIEKPEVLQRIVASNATSVSYRFVYTIVAEIIEDKDSQKGHHEGQIDVAQLRAALAAHQP